MRIFLVAALATLVACTAPGHRDIASESRFELARERGSYRTLGSIDTFVIAVGAGPDIVLLHGNPSSTYTWRHFIEPLSKTHRVHAIDFPGYGFSEKPADAPYTTTWLAGHVAAYMNGAGVERAVVVGNSMGGEIASEVAALYPRQVSHLVLIAPAGLPYDQTADQPLAMRLARHQFFAWLASRLPLRSLLRRTLQDAYFDPARITEADVDAYYLPIGSRNGLTAFLSRVARRETADRSDLVRTISVPTLVVLGEIDRLVPLSVGRKYHDLIAGSQIVVIEQAGHLPQEEQPDKTLGAITTWLQAHQAPPAAFSQN